MIKATCHSWLFLMLLFVGFNSKSAHADPVSNKGFIINHGQWPSEILSRATFSFGDIILQKDGLLFFLRDKRNIHSHDSRKKSIDNLNIHKHDSTDVIHAHVYKMKFRNGNILKAEGHLESPYHINYMKGSDPEKWAGELLCYKKLVVPNIYASIDLVLYATDNGIKYDFILKGKAQHKQIIIDYEGVDSLSIDNDGNLLVKTSLGSITEKMPIAFVEKTNLSKEPVLCRYQLSGTTVRFNVHNLKKSKEETLVIDPELIFATYSGSYADNWGNTATYDSLGCLYAAGVVFDFGFPVTIGAYQISYSDYFSSLTDVGIMKFDPQGTLVYATYLGGDLSEIPTSTIVNDQGELYILGTTSSSGLFGLGDAFPTTIGAYDITHNGGTLIHPLGPGQGISHYYGCDLFVSRLSANGSQLLSSTFIGGSGNDGILPSDTSVLARNYGDPLRSEIILDSAGYVYLASCTESTNIMALRPGYDKTYNGGPRDGIVMKLKPDLSDIVWNTYLGGSGTDACYSLQFGSDRTLFVTGGTSSKNLPAATGLNPSALGGIDGFIFRLSHDGEDLLNGTYIGTPFNDQSYLVQTDKNGFVYVLGQSQGDYPIENASYSNPNSKQFIHKLNSDLNSTIFSTQIGSGLRKIDIVPTAFLVNDCENIFVSGWGGAINGNGRNSQGGTTFGLPITPTGFQKNTDGSDFYLMVLRKDMQGLLYSTYFGGIGEYEHVDGGTSRFDKRGIVYQSVCAGCGGTSKFPVTSNPHSSTNNSTNCNNAVFKFDLSSLKADFDIDTSQICGIAPVTFTNKSLGGSSFLWDLGDGTTSTSSNKIIHTYKNPGTYSVRLIAVDETTCIGRDTIEKTVTVYKLPDVVFNLDRLVICKNDTSQLNVIYNPDYTYSWSPNKHISSTNIHNPLVYPPSSTYYKLHIKDNATQCENLDSIQVVVMKAVADTRYENITGCSGLPSIQIKNHSDEKGFTYQWEFGDGSSLSTTEQTVKHTYNEFGEYTVKVTVFNASCSITDTVHVLLPAVKIPNLFTPNGDNFNDKYVIEGMTKNWRLEVYNRWGNAIYTREPYDQSWDGDGLSEGIYYFLITDPSGNKCKGWVHLIK